MNCWQLQAIFCYFQRIFTENKINELKYTVRYDLVFAEAYSCSSHYTDLPLVPRHRYYYIIRSLSNIYKIILVSDALLLYFIFLSLFCHPRSWLFGIVYLLTPPATAERSVAAALRIWFTPRPSRFLYLFIFSPRFSPKFQNRSVWNLATTRGLGPKEIIKTFIAIAL